MSKTKYLLLLLICAGLVLAFTASAFADRKDFTPLAWDIATKNPGWTYDSPDWAWGMPTGEGGDAMFRGKDPLPTDVGAEPDQNVIGTTLAGNYSPDAEEYATSDAVDCTGKVAVQLEFVYWLAVQDIGHDQAVVEVSNGGDWVRVWANAADEVPAGDYMMYTTGSPLAGDWKDTTVDLSAVADNQEAVQIRFGLISDSEVEYGGWNIKSVILTSEVNSNCCVLTNAVSCCSTVCCFGLGNGTYVENGSAGLPGSIDSSGLQAFLERGGYTGAELDTAFGGSGHVDDSTFSRIPGAWKFDPGWEILESTVGTSGQPLPDGLAPPYDWATNPSHLKGADPEFDAANEDFSESATETGYILGYNVGGNYEKNMVPSYLYLGVNTRYNGGDLNPDPELWWQGWNFDGPNLKLVADRWLAVESAQYDKVSIQYLKLRVQQPEERRHGHQRHLGSAGQLQLHLLRGWLRGWDQ